jgi:hypothetical protein
MKECLTCNRRYVPGIEVDPNRCERCQPTAREVLTAFSLMMEDPALPPTVAMTAVQLDGISLPQGSLLTGGLVELLRLAMVGYDKENT